MVGLKRCYLCSDVLAPGDDMVKCEHCHIWCHRACQADREEQYCPRCDHEAWISVAEL